VISGQLLLVRKTFRCDHKIMSRSLIVKRIVIGFYIFVSLSGCSPANFPEEIGFTATHMKAEDILQHPYWTKQAYQRAEPRLKAVKPNMTLADFYGVIGLKTIHRGKDGPLLALVADGWLSTASNTWVSSGIKINEFVFGYVEALIEIKRAVVRFENERLVQIRFFDRIKSLSDLPSNEEFTIVKTTVKLDTKEAYLKAAERAKNLKPGMDVHVFEDTMNLVTQLAPNNQFYVLGEGFLRELAIEAKHDANGPHRLKKVVFGYKENDQPVPKIVVEFEDGKISRIQWL